VQVPPLLPAPLAAAASEPKVSYAIRRLLRRRTVEEKKYGKASDYTGCDMFISLIEPAGVHDHTSVAELSLRALCSNRHLTEHLPVGEGGADFRLLDDVTLDVMCVAGPTPPREPVVSLLWSRGETAHTGVVAWRLINMLSLNQLGLVDGRTGKDGQALREILGVFGDLADNATERKVRGVRSVYSAPVVRRGGRPRGRATARRVGGHVTPAGKAVRGGGAFPLGPAVA